MSGHLFREVSEPTQSGPARAASYDGGSWPIALLFVFMALAAVSQALQGRALDGSYNARAVPLWLALILAPAFFANLYQRVTHLRVIH